MGLLSAWQAGACSVSCCAASPSLSSTSFVSSESSSPGAISSSLAIAVIISGSGTAEVRNAVGDGVHDTVDATEIEPVKHRRYHQHELLHKQDAYPAHLQLTRLPFAMFLQRLQSICTVSQQRSHGRVDGCTTYPAHCLEYSSPPSQVP